MEEPSRRAKREIESSIPTVYENEFCRQSTKTGRFGLQGHSRKGTGAKSSGLIFARLKIDELDRDWQQHGASSFTLTSDMIGPPFGEPRLVVDGLAGEHHTHRRWVMPMARWGANTQSGRRAIHPLGGPHARVWPVAPIPTRASTIRQRTCNFDPPGRPPAVLLAA